MAIVNAEFTRRVFGDEQSALSGRFRLGPQTSPILEVVGIVRDGKYESLFESRQAVVFLPQSQRTDVTELATGFLLARTDDARAHTVAQAMRREVQQLDPRVPVTTMRLDEDHLSVALMGPRIGAAITCALGLLALVLATTGVDSVMSYSVSRKTREVGIRMAIGARPRDVLNLAVKEGMKVALLAIGSGCYC